MYERVAVAYEQLRTVEEELALERSLESGLITIGASETALRLMLLSRLEHFHTRYPHVRLRISNHSTPQALQAVKNGEVDFAIITTPAEVESGLKMVELKPFYEVLVGGRTFTALASQNLSLKELNNYPLISLSDESMTRAFYRQFFLDHGAVLKPDTEAATTDQMIVHLGSLFRHNLRTKRQQITLEEELDGLEDYIYLQQMRFDGRITVEKSIHVQSAAVFGAVLYAAAGGGKRLLARAQVPRGRWTHPAAGMDAGQGAGAHGRGQRQWDDRRGTGRRAGKN